MRRSDYFIVGGVCALAAAAYYQWYRKAPAQDVALMVQQLHSRGYTVRHRLDAASLWSHRKSSQQKSALIVMAMHEEAEPVIKKLGLIKSTPKFSPNLTIDYYRGMVDGLEIHLVLNARDERFNVQKVGTVSAALLVKEAIGLFKPDLIINAGTAGSLGQHQVGEVVLTDKPVVYHDHRIPLGDYQAYGVGSYPCIDGGDFTSLSNVTTGKLSTGDSLDLSPTDLKQLQDNQATLKDMEGAAIASVAEQCRIPVLFVKSITNVAGVHADAPGLFEKNFSLATRNLAEKIPELITALSSQKEAPSLGAAI